MFTHDYQGESKSRFGRINGTETVRLMLWDDVSELCSVVAEDAERLAKENGGRQWTTMEDFHDSRGCRVRDKNGIWKRESVHHCTKSDFLGREIRDFKHAGELALSEWPEGIQLVEQMLKEIYESPLPDPITTRRRRHKSYNDGHTLDIERLRKGQPFWDATRRRKSVGPTHLTVISEVGASAQTDPRDILWRGAAAIVLMDVLERAGYRCEHWSAKRVKAIGTVDGYSIGELQAVRTKCQGEPLDIVSQINTVSGWFMRSVLFGAKSLTGARLNMMLGSPTSLADCDIREITADSRVLVAEGIDGYETAIKWVTNCVRRYSQDGYVGVEGGIDRGLETEPAL